MNKPNQASEQPVIDDPKVLGVEDNIMGGTPNQIQVDKQFSEKVLEAVEKEHAPKEAPAKENSEPDTSEPNGEGYEPAKEFTDFLASQINQENPDPNAPREAPQQQAAPVTDDKSVQDDPVRNELNELKSLVHNLTNTIHGDRNEAIDRNQRDAANEVYLDVVKDVPDYQRTLSDFFNNAMLRDHALPDINREVMESSNKAVASELDNYFNARAQAEGYTKSTGLPPSLNPSQGELTPPPPQKGTAPYGDPTNRPTGAFDQVDKEFAQKVNNLFSQ